MRKSFVKILIIFMLFLAAERAEAAVFTPYKILIVPGHDNRSFGARYGNMKESDMNLALGEELRKLLEKDYRFGVHITREKSGFAEEFARHFTSQKEEINYFITNAKKQTQEKIESGDFKVRTAVPHRAASEEVAFQLYGINKWANENKANVVIHIHFNDHVRKSRWVIGKYGGFAVYAPDDQFLNAPESFRLAENIFDELKAKYSTSTYPDEKGGLIKDQKLIALGSNGTLAESVNSVLIEYGYIYEKKFRSLTTRQAAYKDMAKRTADGLVSFYFP